MREVVPFLILSHITHVYMYVCMYVCVRVYMYMYGVPYAVCLKRKFLSCIYIYHYVFTNAAAY